MPTPTITFRSKLRTQAAQKAKRIGIPLSVILNQALLRFINSDDTVVIGKPQEIKLPNTLQKKIDALGDLADTAVQKRLSQK